jgi:hypothetical protein
MPKPKTRPAKPVAKPTTYGQIVTLQSQISTLEDQLFWLTNAFLIQNGWKTTNVPGIEGMIRLYAKIVGGERLTLPMDVAYDVQIYEDVRLRK